MKNLRNKLLGLFFFSVIFSTIFYFSSSILFPLREGRYGSTSRIKSFYGLKNNSIDALFIGASSFRNGISPLIIWKEKGFTSFVRATGNQSPAVSYFYLRESLKIIKPKVVVLDGLMLFHDYDYDKNEPALRDAIDPMPLSIEKIELILNIDRLSNEQTIISYIFPFFRYHTRWMKIIPTDIKKIFQKGIPEIYRGQYIDFETRPQKYPVNYMAKVSSSDEIVQSSKTFYEKIIKLCQANDMHLVIISLPRFQSYNYTIHQKLSRFAEENNIHFIDYSFPDSLTKMNINLETDFADPNHLNIWGAMKISKLIAEDINQAFALKDKRSDNNHANWNRDYLTLISEIEKQELVNSQK
jgi:hypothetical protein